MGFLYRVEILLEGGQSFKVRAGEYPATQNSNFTFWKVHCTVMEERTGHVGRLRKSYHGAQPE